MNWTIKGHTNGKPTTMTVVGGADSYEGVIESLKASHPDFIAAPIAAPEVEAVEDENEELEKGEDHGS